MRDGRRINFMRGLRQGAYGLLAVVLLMALTGLIFGFPHWYPPLLLAAFGCILGTSGSETAPFLPVEQAMLGSQGSGAGRTALFARYDLVASIAGACGALIAGLNGQTLLAL